jgi:hypothetical protein
LKDGSVKPLIKLLEDFFGGEPVRTAKDCNQAVLKATLGTFWLNASLTCLSELTLLADPHASHGQSRSAFADLFLPGPSCVCLELKNIPLMALWTGSTSPASDLPLNELRATLRTETETQLLARRATIGGITRTIEEVKQQASEQIIRYINIIKNGVADGNRPGVNDYRIEQGDGPGQLVGYVVILIGGTRTLVWKVMTEVTNFILDVKAGTEELSNF